MRLFVCRLEQSQNCRLRKNGKILSQKTTKNAKNPNWRSRFQNQILKGHKLKFQFQMSKLTPIQRVQNRIRVSPNFHLHQSFNTRLPHHLPPPLLQPLRPCHRRQHCNPSTPNYHHLSPKFSKNFTSKLKLYRCSEREQAIEVKRPSITFRNYSALLSKILSI